MPCDMEESLFIRALKLLLLIVLLVFIAFRWIKYTDEVCIILCILCGHISSSLCKLYFVFRSAVYTAAGHVAKRHGYKDDAGLKSSALEKWNQRPKATIKESCFLDDFPKNIQMPFFVSLLQQEKSVERWIESCNNGANLVLQYRWKEVIGKIASLHDGDENRCDLENSYTLKTVFRMINAMPKFITCYPV